MRNMVARYIDRKGSPKMMIDMSLPEEVFKEVLDSIRPEENLEGTFIGTNIDVEHLKNNMDILSQINEVYDDSVELTFGLIDEWTGEEYK